MATNTCIGLALGQGLSVLLMSIQQALGCMHLVDVWFIGCQSAFSALGNVNPLHSVMSTFEWYKWHIHIGCKCIWTLFHDECLLFDNVIFGFMYSQLSLLICSVFTNDRLQSERYKVLEDMGLAG